MVTLIKRVSLHELSEKALDETLDKYSGALRGYGLTWTWCGICIETENKATYENKDVSEHLICETCCPLYPSEWCRNEKLESRLYDGYGQNNWEIDVNNYLWWITIELELRRTKYERNWGGAW